MDSCCKMCDLQLPGFVGSPVVQIVYPDGGLRFRHDSDRAKIRLSQRTYADAEDDNDREERLIEEQASRVPEGEARKDVCG